MLLTQKTIGKFKVKQPKKEIPVFRNIDKRISPTIDMLYGISENGKLFVSGKSYRGNKMPYDKQIRIYVYHSLAVTPIPIRTSFKQFNSVVDIYEDHEKGIEFTDIYIARSNTYVDYMAMGRMIGVCAKQINQILKINNCSNQRIKDTVSVLVDKLQKTLR